MNSKIGVMAINWVFQGILGADRTEQLFKLLLDLLLTLLLTLGLIHVVTWPMAILIGAILAHTINWLFNGQFWVVGRFCGITHNPPEKIMAYLRSVQRRLAGNPSLLGIAVFGSLARGNAPRTNSDIDLRFIRRPGWKPALKANLIGLTEKTRAFLNGLPLHLFVYDSIESLNRLRADEQPYLLYDPENLLKKKYQQRGYHIFSNF
ncbi:MAG: nucleotidyltransferase domain-containing protein [candidate division KSB1 bacterium]|nr:nucleotidyltransferase domain-containing protein [candidate division KSB1 bacterium]